MHTTIFDTPVVRSIFHWVSIFLLKVLGWKKEGKLPDIEKYVMIAAPHTTNWDFFYTILIAFAFRMKIYWTGKDTIFKQPFRFIVKWMGGIPVNRNRAGNLVEKTIKNFEENDKLVIIIPPEGTRKNVVYWKTGFYRIAHGAGVPILLGFLDYERKAGGFGPLFYPDGDIDKDMKKISDFYSDIKGKYTNKFNLAPDIADFKKGKKCS